MCIFWVEQEKPEGKLCLYAFVLLKEQGQGEPQVGNTEKVFIGKVSINDGSATLCSRIVDEEGNSNGVDIDMNVGVYICDGHEHIKIF